MKKILPALLAVAVWAPSAAAAPGTCLALSDAAGDVNQVNVPTGAAAWTCGPYASSPPRRA